MTDVVIAALSCWFEGYKRNISIFPFLSIILSLAWLIHGLASLHSYILQDIEIVKIFSSVAIQNVLVCMIQQRGFPLAPRQMYNAAYVSQTQSTLFFQISYRTLYISLFVPSANAIMLFSTPICLTHRHSPKISPYCTCPCLLNASQ
jgi:hypothetical protein